MERMKEEGKKWRKEAEEKANAISKLSTCWQLSKMPMGRMGSMRVMKRDGHAEVRESVQG